MGERLRLLRVTQYILQMIALVASLRLAYELFYFIEGRPPFELTSAVGFITFGALLVVWGVVFTIAREGRPDITSPLRSHIKDKVLLSILAMLMYSGLSFMLKFTMLSRLVAIAYAAAVFICFILIVVIIKAALRFTRIRHLCVLVLARTDLTQIERIHREVRAAGLELQGLIADSPHPGLLPHLGQLKDLPSLLESTTIDTVLLHPFLESGDIERCVGECQLRGIPAELLIGHLSLQAATREVVQMPYGTAIRLLPHRTTLMALFLKRVTDIAIAFIALIVLCVPCLIIMILIKTTSDGPVFFVQRRVGLNGRTFPCLKFRTMVPNAEELRNHLLHLNEMSGPVFKITADPRVTSIGRVLRQTSLDELPQLLNVLVGQMSIVGPRPPLPAEVEQYASWQRRRLSVRPGITCLWQIGGRNEVDFDEWMQLDLMYIDQWSYLRDWWIMFKTVPAVLFRHGAS